MQESVPGLGKIPLGGGNGNHSALSERFLGQRICGLQSMEVQWTITYPKFNALLSFNYRHMRFSNLQSAKWH